MGRLRRNEEHDEIGKCSQVKRIRIKKKNPVIIPNS